MFFENYFFSYFKEKQDLKYRLLKLELDIAKLILEEKIDNLDHQFTEQIIDK